MDRRWSILKLRLLPGQVLCATLMGLLLAAGLPPAHVEGRPPRSSRTISFGAGNDVGASADHVQSVTLGDLDHDGDLDIVSVSSRGEDYEVIAWQNDGSTNRSSPFRGNR